ncbi:MAG: hypothetical protein COC14_00040 [Burkholderiaceae bacterium]|nr:MAG: hypothetical protein COC14_00040 [Burkholderiaceae bacterium]
MNRNNQMKIISTKPSVYTQSGQVQKLTMLSTIALVAALSGCGGGSSNSNNDGAEDTVELSRVAAVILFGPTCSFGGNEVETGLDTNGNAVLDDAEVVSSDTVCATSGNTGFFVVDPATVPVDIPDNDIVTGAASSIIVANGPTSIAYVGVHLDIAHTADVDLTISLEAPGGTLIELSSLNGGTSNNYSDTVFSDLATTAITMGAAPFFGAFIPEQALSTLNGFDANGTWILHVYDGEIDDLGTIDDWALLVSDSVPNLPPFAVAGPNQGGFSGGDTVILDGSGSYDLNAGDTLSYQWQFASAPAASTASLTGANTVSPSFVANAPGIYIIELIAVNDGTRDNLPVNQPSATTINVSP